jgi:hypothetical protein
MQRAHGRFAFHVRFRILSEWVAVHRTLLNGWVVPDFAPTAHKCLVHLPPSILATMSICKCLSNITFFIKKSSQE